MNVDTGHLEYLTMAEFEQQAKLGAMVPVDMETATDKQKAEMQVSKHDNRSELGKIFTGNRRERRAQERAYKKLLQQQNNALDGLKKSTD